jgi:hypothetical protein
VDSQFKVSAEIICHVIGLSFELVTSSLMRGHPYGRNAQTELADQIGYVRHIGRFLVYSVPPVTFNF